MKVVLLGFLRETVQNPIIRPDHLWEREEARPQKLELLLSFIQTMSKPNAPHNVEIPT
jgi:hypothetical protein